MMGSLCSADVTPVRSGRSGSGRSGRSGSSRSSRSGSGRSGPVPVGPVGPVPVGPVRFRSVRSVRFRSVLFFYMSNCRVKNAALGIPHKEFCIVKSYVLIDNLRRVTDFRYTNLPPATYVSGIIVFNQRIWP